MDLIGWRISRQWAHGRVPCSHNQLIWTHIKKMVRPHLRTSRYQDFIDDQVCQGLGWCYSPDHKIRKIMQDGYETIAIPYWVYAMVPKSYAMMKKLGHRSSNPLVFVDLESATQSEI